MSEEFSILGKIASLDENESIIYSLLLADGNITKGDLVILSGLAEEEVDGILTKLENERLIVRHTGVIARFHAVPPFHGIAEEVESIGERIQSLRDEIRQQLSSISSTIRNRVLEVSNSTITAIKDSEVEYESKKNEALGQIKSTIDDGLSTLSNVVSSSEKELESTFAEWKSTMPGEIDPNVSEIKNRIISTSTSLKSQMKSWIGSARMSGNTLDENLSISLNQFKDKTLNETERQKQSSTGLIEQKENELREHVQTTLGEFSNRMESLKAEITSKSSAFRDEVSISLNEIVDSTTTTLERKSEEINSMLTSTRDELQDKISEFQDTETSALEAHKESLQGDLESFRSDLKGDLDALDGRASEALASFTQQTDTTFSSINDQLNGLLKQTENHLQVVADRMFQLNKDAMNALHQRSISGFNKMARTISSVLSETHTTFNENIKSMGTQLTQMNDSLLETSVSHVSKTKDSIINEIQVLSENMRTRVNDVVSTAIAELQRLSDDLNESITSLVSSASSSITTQADSRISELQEHHDSFQPEIDEFINKEAADHRHVFEDLNSRIDESCQSLDGELDIMKNQHLATLQSALENAKDSGLSTITQLRDESNEILDVLKTSYAGVTSDLQASFKSSISAANDGLATATKKLNAEIEEQVSTQIANANRLGNQLKTSISDHLENARESITSTLQDTISQSSSVLASATDQASTQFEEMNKNGLSSVDNVIESLTDFTSSLQSGLSMALTNIKASLISLLDTVSSLSNESADESLSQIRSAISNIEAELDNLQSSGETGIDAIITDSKQSIEGAAQKIKDSTVSITEQFKMSSAKILQKSKKLLKSELNGLKGGLETNFGKAYDQFIGITSSLRNEIEKIAGEVEKSEMLGTTQELLEKAFPSSESIADTDAEVINTLASVWSKIGATNFPGAKKTWAITSRDVILTHISDMIERAKPKATLIFPFIHEVPVEMLSQLKTTTGVEVVVTDEPGLSDRLRPIIGKGNIRVRVRSGRDVYACVRDSEEVLLAPATDKDEDVVGVLTVDDGFVKFIMSIIGPIFQAKTKLIRPEDL